MGTVRAVQRVGRRWLIDLAVVPEIDAPFEALLRVSAEGEEPRAGDCIALVHLDRRVMALEHPPVFRRPPADRPAGIASTSPTGENAAADPLATLRLVFDALRAPDAHLPRILVDPSNPPAGAGGEETPGAADDPSLDGRQIDELLIVAREDPAAVAAEVRRRLAVGTLDRRTLATLMMTASPAQRATIAAVLAAWRASGESTGPG